MQGLHQRTSSALECSTSGRRPTNLRERFSPLSRRTRLQRASAAPAGPSGSGSDGRESLSSSSFSFLGAPSLAPAPPALPRLRPSIQPQPSGNNGAGQGSGAGSASSSQPSSLSPESAQPRQPQPQPAPLQHYNGSSNGGHFPGGATFAGRAVKVDTGTQTSTEVPTARPPSPSPNGTSSTTTSTTTSSNGSNGPPLPSGPSQEDKMADALTRAQEAISRAESSLESIEDLPSAQPPSKFAGLFQLIRTVVITTSLAVGLVASHAFGLGIQWASALAAACGIAWWGYSRSALATSGALAALAVGGGTIGCSLRFGVTLLAFFFSSSKLTAFKEEYKDGLDDASKAGGQRDWKQVFCNGAIPTAIAIAYGVLVGCVDVPMGPSPQMELWRAKLATLLGGAFLGYYACCCGDTWASELGPLSSDSPRLITTLRPVRKGTNGGVTLLGLSASILGGMFVGAVFYAAAIVSPTLWILEGQQAAAVGQWRLIPLGLMAGLLGSVLDSVLGATLQYTGYNRTTGRVTSKPGDDVVHISGVTFLDNNMVNMVSATTTAALTALAACHMFGF